MLYIRYLKKHEKTLKIISLLNIAKIDQAT